MRHAVDASPWKRASDEATVVAAAEPTGPEPRIDAVEQA
jgi:hypothetical protein